MPNEPDLETLSYWVTRLEPLIRSDNQDEIVVVFCNRTGNEDEVTYAGTSAVIGILDGEVKVYGLLGRGEKELLVVDTDKPPYAKLLYRPSGHGAELLTHSKESQSAPKPSSEAERALPLRIPSTLKGGADEASSRGQGTPKRRAAPIKVPETSSTLSPDSSVVESSIPTPSAPSPTPMAVRPKLVIPESPPLSSHHYLDHPTSAASMTSNQSYKSEDSEASTQTVRSNHRPPEDSTPYPHSGAPQSGYPSNRWEKEKRIYGGNVTIDRYEDKSPTTPFQDMSPLYNHQTWHQNEGFRKASQPAIAGMGGTPVGRRPEPFPWAEITREQESTHPNKGGATNDYPAPKTPSQRTGTPVQSHALPFQPSSKSRSAEPGTNNDPRSIRPSSPKSRNASRPRGNERNNITIKDNDPVASGSSNVQNRPQSVSSAGGLRPLEDNCAAERPTSPKSRNCSRNRPSGTAEFWLVDPHTIPIAASPSIFRRDANTGEAKRFYQSPSRALSQSNPTFPSTNSYSSAEKRTPTVPSRSMPRRPVSRATSRGRQLASADPEFRAEERSTSRDSVTNDQLHTRVHRRESLEGGRMSLGERRSSRSSSHQPALTQYERIEVISCSNCPVHGQQSGSSASQRGTPERSISAQVPSASSIDPANGDDGSQVDLTPTTQIKPQDIEQAVLESSVASPGERGGEGSSNLSSSGSPSFDPPTPKAMAFNKGDTFLESTRKSNDRLDTSTAVA